MKKKDETILFNYKSLFLNDITMNELAELLCHKRQLDEYVYSSRNNRLYLTESRQE